MLAGTAPVTRRVRAYFAPVNRSTGTPTMFDPAQAGTFALDEPPAPWVDLGWCMGFSRKSGSKITDLKTGAPAVTQAQARTELDATVQVEFEQWGKLQLALSAGAEQMNLLVTAAGASANGSGGAAAGAVPLVNGTGSSATSLNVGVTAGKDGPATHSLSTVLVGKDGKVIAWYPTNDWKPADVVARIRQAAAATT